MMTAHTTLNGPTFPHPPPQSVKRLVILLHGLGADGQDLIGLAPLLAQALPDTLFISPNAPQPCDMAPVGYQWFSLRDWSMSMVYRGIVETAPLLDTFITAQRDHHGLTDENIALVGFSQGTMMALHVALRRSAPLAGVAGFSGLLAGAEALETDIQARPPVLLVHGQEDQVVPFACMTEAEAHLQQHDVSVQTLARPTLGHGIDERGIEVCVNFLTSVFSV